MMGYLIQINFTPYSYPVFCLGTREEDLPAYNHKFIPHSFSFIMHIYARRYLILRKKIF